MLSDRQLDTLISKANSNAVRDPNLARDVLSFIHANHTADLVREMVLKNHACGPDCICWRIREEIGA